MSTKKKTAKKKKPNVQIIRNNPLERLAISKILVGENVRDPGWEKGVAPLMKSIKANGLEQPVKVQALTSPGPNKETHRLVWGFRRLAACKKLGWTVIPVVNASARDTERDRFISALVENTARKFYTPLEEARIFRKAIDKHGMTVKQIAKMWVIKDEPVTDGYVSQRLALLRMPEPVQKAVQEERITPTHARELQKVKDPTEQKKLLKKAEKMPLTAFKDEVNAVDPAKRSQSKRGRPTKKPTKSAADAAKARPRKELTSAMGKLDKKRKKARTSGTKADLRYIEGLLRGIGWAAGNVKELEELG